MVLKTNRIAHFHTLLRILPNSLKNISQNPYFGPSLVSPNSYQLCFLNSISWKPFSNSAQLSQNPEEKSPIAKKSLSEYFKEAVGISVKFECCGVVDEETEGKNADLKEKLRKLEEKVRSLKKESHENDSTLKSHPLKHDKIVPKVGNYGLSALFRVKKINEEKKMERSDLGNEDHMVYKKLSPDMQSLAYCLFKRGYLKDANFISGDEFDPNVFEVSYARDYLKSAAVRFGEDHQEIAKWLSASDLKKVALFGCPSLVRKNVYAAKNLRGYFKVHENKVCEKCVLKDSCKLANKASNVSKLRLCDVIKILIIYGLESVPQELVVPEGIHICVSNLLKEVLNLSETVSH